MISGRRDGARIDIQPSGEAVGRRLGHAPAPGSGARRSGTRSPRRLEDRHGARPLGVETQALARYTQDEGNHVLIEVPARGRRSVDCPERSSSSPTCSARPGRRAVEDAAAGACARSSTSDFCVVNGENAADGRGMTPRLAEQAARGGRRRDHARATTSGAGASFAAVPRQSERVIRPANLSRHAPGRGLPSAEARGRRRRSR